ncbi:protein disulfide-isomerase 5-2-like isoform X2 [Salvia hispanica]|uniref:protein disulfide-isomerase 5-2-like isoform X2 n=1 Tax=Salvia hispanica TaxID=49212 RepID=UPI0020091BC4|nr:protein disulfide-isomerase 5-2-like isoform X2 [Salvia hispanica]
MPCSSPTIHSSSSIISLRSLLLVFSFSLSLSITANGNQFKLDGSVLELDDSNFDAAISKFDYIFVDFYAPWCGHCNRLMPELERAAPVLAGLRQPIVVAKVDADKHKKLASKHNVDGFPTLKMFMHGVPTEYYGPRKADLLVQSLAKFVAPDVSVLSSDSDVRDFVKAAEKSLEDYISKSLLPLVFPISQGSLKLLQDDERKVLLTIIKDEKEEKSRELFQVLKAAASANRDLVFGYVGLQQWEDFAQSFEVDMKTEFPRMVVWDGNENYYLVTGSENGDKTDMASQVSRFLEGYREGRVIHKRIIGPSLLSLMNSKVAIIVALLLICVVLAVVLIVAMVQDEPLTVGTRDKVVEQRSSSLHQESEELLGPFKED